MEATGQAKTVWRGVVIRNRKLPGDNAWDRKGSRTTWPLAWVDPCADGLEVSEIPKGDMGAWIEMSRERLDQLSEAKDPCLDNEFVFSSHDGRFTTIVNQIEAPQFSLFNVWTVKLYSVEVRENQ